MRKIQFVNNEYYHILNRGVDKREIFSDYEDMARFFQSMHEFNTLEPIGSIFENSFRQLGDSVSKDSENLVDFVSYCLNPNHFHFILRQLTDKGIEKFMHRIGVGYTMYFNNKHERNGSLFQGGYKAIHINSNEYLLHLSAYVNLNNKVHQLGDSVSKSKSSWNEYVNNYDSFCKKDIIMSQFNNILEYRNFAEESLKDIRERKEAEKFLLE
ncbi:transposase [Patescibacteria group bacterium]|nr:transposase [Patescibacteria group bacterium]